MEIRVKEWGNSQEIRFPKAILQEVVISVHDTMDIKVENGKIVLNPFFRHKTLVERIRESGCKLSGIGELDWGEPKGNEVW